MASRPTSGTSSRSSASVESADEVRAHSAIHVLKGAATKVLGKRRFVFAQAGELRLSSDGPVGGQEVSKIEAAANDKIAEDAEILEFKMERQEAEGHFGPGIFDLSPPREEGALVSIVRIPDWEVSCCSLKHVEGTGSIGTLKIDRADFDDTTRALELRFRLV